MARARRLPLALVLLALAGCSGSKHEAAPTTTDATGCFTVSQPKPETRKAPRPTTRLDPAKRYDITFRTNCGSFTLRLAVKTSPKTAASFVSLVRRHFFDGTIFHRIVPGFVIQGGDPTASGLGGPGYTTVDKPPAATRYTLGVAAMAKAGNQPAGAAGSQFFVVTAQDAQLPPDYAVLGSIVAGLPVVERIGQLGDPASGGQGTPNEIVEIEKARVRVS
jgi:peptidyl-prolyl cis-trans isomerase B (cyclophilin B)